MIGYITKLINVPYNQYIAHQAITSLFPSPQTVSWIRDINGQVIVFSTEKFMGKCHINDIELYSVTEVTIPDVGDEFIFFIPYIPTKTTLSPRDPKTGKSPRGITATLYGSDIMKATNFLKKRLEDLGVSIDALVVEYNGIESIHHKNGTVRSNVFHGNGVGKVNDQSKLIKLLLDGIPGSTKYNYLGY